MKYYTLLHRVIIGLQSLQLGDLTISAEEMARIRRTLPDVRIVF